MGIESVGVKNGKQPGREERCRVMGMEIGDVLCIHTVPSGEGIFPPRRATLKS
jgi:hypothetical protein